MFTKRELLKGALGTIATLPVGCNESIVNAQSAGGYVRSVSDLENACRIGGRHIVHPGVYVLGDRVLRPVSGTHLVAQRGQVILQKTTSAGSYRLRAFFDVEDASDVTLDGLILDHRAKRTEHGLIVRSTKPGTSSKIRMRNCELRQCHVHLERFVHGVIIEDTRFLGDGVALAGIATGGQISKVDGRPINSNGAVDDIRLERLYFERTFTEAIDINWHTQNIYIRDIHAYNCDVGGVDEVIDIGGDVHTTATNACRNISLENVTIENDTPGQTDTVGIHVKGQSRNVSLRNIKMKRVSATGNNAGIRIWNTNETLVDGLVVDGYAYGVVSAAAGYRPPEAITLKNVDIKNYRRDAIQLEGRGIALEGFNIDGARADGVGLELIGVSGIVMRNGTMRHVGVRGLRVGQYSSEVLVEDVTADGLRSGKAFDIRSRNVKFAPT